MKKDLLRRTIRYAVVFLPGFVPGTRPRKKDGRKVVRTTIQAPLLELEALKKAWQDEVIENKGQYEIVQVGGFPSLKDLLQKYEFLEDHGKKIFKSAYLLDSESVWQAKQPLFWAFLPGRINNTYPSGSFSRFIVSRTLFVVGPGCTGGLFDEFYPKLYRVTY